MDFLTHCSVSVNSYSQSIKFASQTGKKFLMQNSMQMYCLWWFNVANKIFIFDPKSTASKIIELFLCLLLCVVLLHCCMSRYSAQNISCCSVCYHCNLTSHFLSHRPGLGRVVWRDIGGQFQRCAGVWQQQQSEEQRIGATGERHQETQVLLHSCSTFHLQCQCVTVDVCSSFTAGAEIIWSFPLKAAQCVG